jgi:hypothetical protein
MFFVQFERICRDYGFSPSYVIKALGYSSSKLTAWKNGSIPNVKILNELSCFFGIDVNNFFKHDIYSHTNMNLFFTILNFLCDKNSVSLDSVFDSLDIKHETVVYWKKGNVPSNIFLESIAKYFNVSCDVLTGAYAHNFTDTKCFLNSIYNDDGTVRVYGDISGGIVQGIVNGSVVINNGNTVPLSDEAFALLDIYQRLDIKSKTKLLNFAFSLEEEK